MKSVRGKKKSLFIRFCIFAFAAYVVVSLITLQMEISSKRSLLTSVNAQLEDQVVANSGRSPWGTTGILWPVSRATSSIWVWRTSAYSVTQRARKPAFWRVWSRKGFSIKHKIVKEAA